LEDDENIWESHHGYNRPQYIIHIIVMDDISLPEVVSHCLVLDLGPPMVLDLVPYLVPPLVLDLVPYLVPMMVLDLVPYLVPPMVLTMVVRMVRDSEPPKVIRKGYYSVWHLVSHLV
jgi:hypothetical protein